MSISIIKNNTILYPIDVYKKYNIYLIDKYNFFLKTVTHEKVIIRFKEIIIELQELLTDNTSDVPNKPLSITKLLNTTDWEDELISHYKLLNDFCNLMNISSILNIEAFLRKEKLEKLNSL